MSLMERHRQKLSDGVDAAEKLLASNAAKLHAHLSLHAHLTIVIATATPSLSLTPLRQWSRFLFRLWSRLQLEHVFTDLLLRWLQLQLELR